MLLATLITYGQAIILGLLQGVSELFPISSLGHSVLLPKLLGWDDLVKAQSQESFFLAFLVALHVGTAVVTVGATELYGTETGVSEQPGQ